MAAQERRPVEWHPPMATMAQRQDHALQRRRAGVTYEAIGREMQLPRERVRQLIARAELRIQGRKAGETP